LGLFALLNELSPGLAKFPVVCPPKIDLLLLFDVLFVLKLKLLVFVFAFPKKLVLF
jgi:hypothetical protein